MQWPLDNNTSQMRISPSTSPGSSWHPPKRDLLTDKNKEGENNLWGLPGHGALLVPILAKPWVEQQLQAS